MPLPPYSGPPIDGSRTRSCIGPIRDYGCVVHSVVKPHAARRRSTRRAVLVVGLVPPGWSLRDHDRAPARLTIPPWEVNRLGDGRARREQCVGPHTEMPKTIRRPSRKETSRTSNDVERPMTQSTRDYRPD